MKRHSKNKKTVSKEKYEFREVICHECRYRFMWEKSRQWQYAFLVDGKEDFRFKKAVCPKCGKELMVREGIPESRAYDKESSRIISMVLKGI